MYQYGKYLQYIDSKTSPLLIKASLEKNIYDILEEPKNAFNPLINGFLRDVENNIDVSMLSNNEPYARFYLTLYDQKVNKIYSKLRKTKKPFMYRMELKYAENNSI